MKKSHYPKGSEQGMKRKTSNRKTDQNGNNILGKKSQRKMEKTWEGIGEK
jgi:hypothetical protein